jgi:hypothetical protein
MHRGDAGDCCLVIHPGKFVGRQTAVGKRLGQGAGIEDFGAGEADFPQNRIRQRAQAGRIDRSRHRLQPTPDSSSGLVADLLADDCLQQAGKARRADTPGERSGRCFDPCKIGVFCDQAVKRRPFGG